MNTKSVGKAIDRVDGRLKVTGAAKYATDFTAKDTAHAVLVDSTIAKGKIKEIDAGAALKAPGVLAVITHKNVPKLRSAKEDFFKGGKPGEDRLPFADDVIYYAGQYVAMVVADSLERAIYAAGLVKATYTEEKPLIEHDEARGTATKPAKSFGEELQYHRGDADKALADPRPSRSNRPTRRRLRRTTRWSCPARWPFGKATSSPFTTRRSGSKGRRRSSPTCSAWRATRSTSFVRLSAAASAARALLGRTRSSRRSRRRSSAGPVKLRDNAHSDVRRHGAPPFDGTEVGAGGDERRQADGDPPCHDAGDFAGRRIYRGVRREHQPSHVRLPERDDAAPSAARQHRHTDADARTPARTPGTFALESALDELAYALKIDPVELRVVNHTAVNPANDKPWSSNHLKECYRIGAEKFGWKDRNAGAALDARRQAACRLGHGDGDLSRLSLSGVGAGPHYRRRQGRRRRATHELGTGAYTVFAQTAADALGCRLRK